MLILKGLCYCDNQRCLNLHRLTLKYGWLKMEQNQ